MHAQGRASRSPQPAAGGLDDRARTLFESGRSAYDSGNYSQALEHFQQAYELSDRPQLLYNIGQCADRMRLDETALAAFRRYIERVPDAANRYQVEQRISVLEDVVSTKLDADASEGEESDRAAQPAQRPETANSLDASLKPTSNPQADSQPSIWSKWWLWAAAGGVVAVAVVSIAIASGGSETKNADRVNGSDGRVIATLSWGGK